MNKKLLAVAVVGALASPAAFAQGTPTTLYGIFDVGYQYASSYGQSTTGGISAKNHNFVEQGMRDPSRFGIKGSEDLEAGMYAMYGFEFNMPIDSGGNADISRIAFVGLGSKSWGELTLGRQYTHLFHTYAVGSAHAYGTFTSGYGWSGIGTRVSNGIKYSSPVFNGFSIGAIWSPSGQNFQEPGKAGTDVACTSTSTASCGFVSPSLGDKQNYWDAAIRWTPGPFGAAAGYGQNKQDLAAAFTPFSISGTGTLSAGTPLPAGTLKSTITELSGNWDNKAFGIYATYNKHKTDVAGTTASDWKIWTISGVARFGGRHEVYAMGGQAKNSVGGTEPKTTQYGLVYENVMSKRTRLYVGYGYAKNEGGARLGPTAYAPASAAQISILGTFNPTNIQANEKPKAFQVGVSHSF